MADDPWRAAPSPPSPRRDSRGRSHCGTLSTTTWDGTAAFGQRPPSASRTRLHGALWSGPRVDAGGLDSTASTRPLRLPSRRARRAADRHAGVRRRRPWGSAPGSPPYGCTPPAARCSPTGLGRRPRLRVPRPGRLGVRHGGRGRGQRRHGAAVAVRGGGQQLQPQRLGGGHHRRGLGPSGSSPRRVLRPGRRRRWDRRQRQEELLAVRAAGRLAEARRPRRLASTAASTARSQRSAASRRRWSPATSPRTPASTPASPRTSTPSTARGVVDELVVVPRHAHRRPPDRRPGASRQRRPPAEASPAWRGQDRP
jgi:hypothetical protein